MNGSILTIKIDPELNRAAKKVATDLGFDLQALLKGFLNQLVRTKTVPFSKAVIEKPNAYMRKLLKESKTDIKAGKVSPTFDRVKDAIKWLNNPRKKYANSLR